MASTIKYIYSDEGEQEAVILPIAIWNSLKSQLNLSDENPVPEKQSFAALQGIISEIPIHELEAAIHKIRKEWDNNL